MNRSGSIVFREAGYCCFASLSYKLRAAQNQAKAPNGYLIWPFAAIVGLFVIILLAPLHLTCQNPVETKVTGHGAVW